MQEKIINILSELAQLDIDAVQAYEQALDRIDVVDIYNEINNFKNDHVRHIDDLNAMISKLGGDPLDRSVKDFKGYLIEGMTFLKSITGTKSALSAMRSNEETTNKNYKNALEMHPDLPDDARQLLEKNYSDEKRHLAYIVKVLDEIKDK